MSISRWMFHQASKSCQVLLPSKASADGHRTVKPLHIAITETVEAVAEMSMTMSKSLAETVMVRRRAHGWRRYVDAIRLNHLSAPNSPS